MDIAKEWYDEKAEVLAHVSPENRLKAVKEYSIGAVALFTGKTIERVKKELRHGYYKNRPNSSISSER